MNVELMTALREVERLAAILIGRFPAACGGRHHHGRTCDYCLVDDILRAARAGLQGLDPQHLAERLRPPEANNDEVICPHCTHQFRAIPVNVQRLLLAAGVEPPFATVPEAQEESPECPQCGEERCQCVAHDDCPDCHCKPSEKETPSCRYGCGPCRDEMGPWHQRGCLRYSDEVGR